MVKLPQALGFGREIESILLILSDHPEEIVRKIADKKSVGDYRLVGEKTKLLADTYFDTPNHFLSHRKLNLRIRTDNQDRWITMKTHPRRTLWGGMVRSEMEVPWSNETIEKVVSELKIPHHSSSNAGQTNLSDPIELLKSKGLVPIQHRETQRQVRGVTLGPEGSHVLAELDIDSVLYDFDDQSGEQVRERPERGQERYKESEGRIRPDPTKLASRKTGNRNWNREAVEIGRTATADRC